MARKSGNKKGDIEVYKHDDTRKNAVLVRLASSDTSKLKLKKYAYDPHLDPQFVWAGKAEHTSVEVLTVSLHIHERKEIFGREVDLVEKAALRNLFRRYSILRSKEVIYAV